jgi:cytochrome P450
MTNPSLTRVAPPSVLPARRPPSPPRLEGAPLFGSTLEAWKDPLALVQRAHREKGDFALLTFGRFRVHVVNDPEAVFYVLSKNQKNYEKSRSYQGLKLFLGEGLLTSEGEFWKRQRRLAAPAFHHRALQGFADQMVECTQSLLDEWSSAPSHHVVDAHSEMMRLTFRIVGMTLFSTDVEGAAREVGEALGIALEHADDYANAMVRVPPWVPTPRNLRFRRARKILDDLVFAIIEQRRTAARSGEATPNDLLGLLMQATDEGAHGGERARMTDRELRDEVMTLVLAGHETTANALSWALYLLSRHPAVERALHAEVESVLQGRAPRFEDLPQLVYTERVVQESMRLFPPAWGFERQAIDDDVVGGFEVRRGDMVAICPYTLHRHPSYWDNPEGFDPDRFAPERGEGRPRCAYLPFGDGARVCIGKGFAMMEAKLLLAMIAQRFRLPLVPGHPIALEPRITLRPRYGVRVELHPRR